jgi:hypothetical protein
MWIDRVLGDIAQMTVEPETLLKPLEPNEEVIGTVPEAIRKYSIYLDLLFTEMNKLREQAQACDSKKETREIENRVTNIGQTYELVRIMLWKEIRDHIEMIPGDKEHLYLRKEWAIARPKPMLAGMQEGPRS